MLRFKLNTTWTTFDKCIACVRNQPGGVTAMQFATLHKTSFRSLRNTNSNLNNLDHVLADHLNSNLQLRKISEMQQTRTKYVPTGNVWTYHDILKHLASNNKLPQQKNIQFVEVEVQKVPGAETKKSTASAAPKAPNLGKPYMVCKTLTQDQFREYSTTRNPPVQENKAKLSTVIAKVTTTELPNRGRSPVVGDDKKVQKLFPQPKYSLNHVYITLAEHFADKSYQLSPRFEALKQAKGKCHWECTYHVKWPELINFTAVGSTKQDASNKACIQGLQHLYNNGHITIKNMPIIPGQEEAAKRQREHIEPLVLKQEILDTMQEIVHEYEGKMLPHLQPENLEESETESLTPSEEIWPVYTEQRAPKFRGVDYYTCREGKTLPISDFKDTIIKTINSNRVVIIKGEPGCGKSTRVPQYILEGWARAYDGGSANNKCRVIVTQPRRIAAISLAERVASERAELPGATVGFQVRLKSNFNRHTGKILYCTTGILLRRLQSDPSLSDCTHVVLDEAHERDVNTDLLLNLLKGAMEKNPNLKLVVMSATIKAELFQDYFNRDQEYEVNGEGGLKAEIVHVPGFTYPVETYFLDGPEMKESGLALEGTLTMTKSDAPSVVAEDVVKVLKYIHKNKPEGAILVFLPGWEDILRVKKLLPEDNKMVQVLCLHSRMPDSEQRMIFHKFPAGVRKIILATNIAETSVTIDDVAYVVDSGIQKENRFDVEKGISIIDNHWISKASSTQRKGRAGRVQAGEAFRLYPESKFRDFHDYSIPEIQRTSLTKIVLDSKVYSNNMKAAEFLGQLITPPEDTAIDSAVDELVELELLDEAENLTPLGKVISDFQLEPKLAKALVNSVIYKCVTPIVDIVTYFSAEMEVFGGGLRDREKMNKTKRDFSGSSDHLSMMRLMEQWLEHVENGNLYDAERFCRKHNIVDYKLRTLQQLRNIHFDYLHKGLHDSLPLSDDFSDSDELVKAVLLSGVGTVLQHRDHDMVKKMLKKKHVLLTRHNHKATISSDSVNHKRANFPTNFLLYINETRSNVRRMTVIRETSLITPLTVLLFKNNDIVIEPARSSNIDGLQDPVVVRLDGTQISFLAERDQAILLQKCKQAVTAGVDYYIYQLTKGAEYDRQVNNVWDGILKKLNSCLRSEAQRIAF